MMTMDERVEAANAAYFSGADMAGVLAAAFPELHGDKPTHWLAPRQAMPDGAA